MGLTGIASGEIGDKTQEPTVDPRKAIRKKTITCVECGKTFKTITKRHLETHGLDARRIQGQVGDTPRASHSPAGIRPRARSDAHEKHGALEEDQAQEDPGQETRNQ